MGFQVKFAAHHFGDNGFSFSTTKYSELKFGSDAAARHFGYELADTFFNRYQDHLVENQSVVIPSPYNYVPNAATVLTRHFCDRLNEHIISRGGEHVEYTIIHRKVSYTKDYGFLSKEKRKSLIDNDSFAMNKDFIAGKQLIFVDDIKITGTHEEKLIEIMQKDGIQNNAFFLYIGNYFGESPEIEAQLNFAGVKCLADYVRLTEEPNHHMIIRPIKYILSRQHSELRDTVPHFSNDVLLKIYNGCLAEGYYKIPEYEKAFRALKLEKHKRGL